MENLARIYIENVLLEAYNNVTGLRTWRPLHFDKLAEQS